MLEFACGMFLIGILCALFGLIYPLCALIAYPIYRLLGGRKRLVKYIKEL